MSTKEFILENSVDEGFLGDWYIHSVSDEDPPVWTEDHIAELVGDFYIIPKEAINEI